MGKSTYASTNSSLAIVDVILQLNCSISTVAVGMVASLSVLILASGTKGKRYSLPNTRILMQQPRYGTLGPLIDVKLQEREFKSTMRIISDIYMKLTGLPSEVIEKEM